MAINFKSVSYRNFLSTGNQPTKIYLNRVPSVLITGHNGAGKSTILDAVTFGLYGKPYRNINKPQLVNTVNDKGLEVQVEFDVNNVPYKVIRGVKPGIFEIYQNGNLLKHDAAIKDYQRKLEDIIGLNYKAFTQIVILGSARYQSFMDLSTNDRRTIIEEILDITVFSKMNAVLKTQLQTVELDIKENNYQKDINKTKIDGQKTLITSITNRQKETDEQLLQAEEKTRAEISLLTDRISEIDSEITSEESSQLDELQEALRDVQSKAKDVARKAQEFDKRVSFYQTTDTCHSCEQSLSEELKRNQIEKYTEEKKKLSDLAPTIAKAIESAEHKVKEETDRTEKIQVKIDQRKSLIADKNALERTLQSLQLPESKETTSESELDRAKRDLEVLEVQQKTLEKESVALAEDRHGLEICKILLKDDGIKAKIIKQYLPIMNQMINQYLDRMGANYSFHLDEQFQEVIKSRYRDNFSYASFSEGEKMRIDLALMFTWREIAKLKNSVNTNLLIMDEVGDSSLDAEATDVLWDIVGNLENTNVFVISHKTTNSDKFRSLIEFVKDGNFSKIRDSK